MDLQNNLGPMMEKRGLTEARLAALSGLAQGHINLIKNGRKKPAVLTALRLAKALGCRVEELFSLKQPKGRAA